MRGLLPHRPRLCFRRDLETRGREAWLACDGCHGTLSAMETKGKQVGALVLEDCIGACVIRPPQL